MDEVELKLQKQARISQVLKELRNFPGWQEFVNLITEIYDEESDKLNEGENPDARAMKKALREIAERFDLKIKEGEVAKTQLKQMFGTG